MSPVDRGTFENMFKALEEAVDRCPRTPDVGVCNIMSGISGHPPIVCTRLKQTWAVYLHSQVVAAYECYKQGSVAAMVEHCMILMQAYAQYEDALSKWQSLYDLVGGSSTEFQRLYRMMTQRSVA